MDIESCKGLSIKLKNGTKILDFTSGIGVLALGHNHPKILEAEALCHQLELIDVQKFGINRLQSVLAFNISTMMPDPLDTSFFTVSGAEAVEAGIKLITRIQPKFKKNLSLSMRIIMVKPMVHYHSQIQKNSLKVFILVYLKKI